MIICSCAVIRQEELREVTRKLYRSNPGAPITPNRVYRALGKSPTCMDCAPLLTLRIYATAQEVIVAEGLLRGDAHPRRIK
ncbi:MAG TPA: hypothetical protein PKA33_11185 [Amaricoccus sp.]|uniref:hypothetical protein n=1 Tax=Amaricoccus sp. TaxID=1872485 RepID=UPI001DBD7C40|nr:hypothetical protein [Amaricoccus sp.]MCB1370983.1 hypothetical protein [Paracoccaceae bacterium]MCC0066777.1 hypothetical protein [Rhodovulum sp.]HRY23952.1 hypothetical protein [Geminicoccaceae bacterium]MCB1372821.1 hypothetical protein [Paracoccaceae bacterium]MCB1403476.1 hypothetical protein [Paracoccaceae bacterium]